MIQTESAHKINILASGTEPVRVLLVYPNSKDVALANLGFQRVHILLNQISGVECDHYSLPVGWSSDVQQLESSSILSHEWNWPLDIVLKILRLGNSAMVDMSFNNQGLLQITVDSGMSKFTYLLPARS